MTIDGASIPQSPSQAPVTAPFRQGGHCGRAVEGHYGGPHPSSALRETADATFPVRGEGFDGQARQQEDAMKKIEASFHTELTDFRRASYYGLFLRHRRALQILFLVLGAALLYYIGARINLGTPNPLVFFLAAAYLVWGLLLFAGAEKEIRRYIKSPDSLIGCEYRVLLEDHRIRIEIPEKKVRESFNLHSLHCCFELASMFLIYTTPQNVYLLPKRALEAEEIEALREELVSSLGERFSSRFVKKGKR